MAGDKDLQPLLGVRQNQLSFELGVSDVIDTKSLALLAANLAILLFMAQAKLDVEWWGYAFSVLPYLVSLAVTILTIWPRDYSGAGVKLSDHPEYLNMKQEPLLLQLIADTEAAIQKNEDLNKKRLRYFISAIALAGLATIALFGILII